MNDLPQGWEWTTVDEATLPVKKMEPRKRPQEYFRYIDIGGINPDAATFTETKCFFGHEAPSRARQIVKKGDTVLSTVRVNLRKTAFIPTDLDGYIASTGFSILRPANGVHPRFLLYQVIESSFVNKLASRQTGSSYPAVRDRDVRTMPLALPSLAEQERIVAVIEEYFSHLDTAKVSLETARRRVGVLRRSVFSQAIDSSFREAPLGDALERIEAGKSYKSPGGKAGHDEWGVVKVSAMTWGSFDEEEHKVVPATVEVDPRYEIEPGDLLLSRANTSTLVGASVLVGRTRPKLLLSDKSMRLHPREGIDKAWLHLALSSPQLRAQMSALATGTSDSMRNISQAKVRQLRLPLPPHSVQLSMVTKIEQQLSQAARLEAALDASERKLEALRRSILAAAFAGELVPQDPGDEPASALLERIRASQPAAKVRKSRKKSLA